MTEIEEKHFIDLAVAMRKAQRDRTNDPLLAKRLETAFDMLLSGYAEKKKRDRNP